MTRNEWNNKNQVWPQVGIYRQGRMEVTRAAKWLTLVLKIRVFLPFICTISFSFIATSLQSNKHVVIPASQTSPDVTMDILSETEFGNRRDARDRSRLVRNASQYHDDTIVSCAVNNVRQRRLNRSCCYFSFKPFHRRRNNWIRFSKRILHRDPYLLGKSE